MLPERALRHDDTEPPDEPDPANDGEYFDYSEMWSAPDEGPSDDPPF